MSDVKKSEVKVSDDERLLKELGLEVTKERLKIAEKFIQRSFDEGREDGVRESHERCLKDILAEEELEGPLPDNVWRVWQAVRDNREEVCNMLKAIVTSTKREIMKRIRARYEKVAEE